MTRTSDIKEKLDRINANTGDTITISFSDAIFTGVLMPHHQFSDPDVLILKLPNGYNIGLHITNETNISLVNKQSPRKKTLKTIPFDKEKTTISIIGTGGTIACYVDYRTGAVHPATSSEDLAFSVPEIFDICNVKTEVAYQLLSENIEPIHWQTLAEKVANALNSGSKGVVIPHGTDTMGYTAAALSFMLQDITGPIVLVGAQRSSDRPSSDAAHNLLAAVTLASKGDIGEVVIVMHAESSDTMAAIHRGTCVRKCHTSRRDAFTSVNTPVLGYITDTEIKLEQPYRTPSKGPVTVDKALETDVAILYSYPGMRPEDVPEKKGLVLMGTGLGHVSTNLLPRIKELIAQGTTIVMSSQCIFGRVNMNVYSTGRDLLNAGVIPTENMLAETAYVKLMWALAHGKTKEQIELLMNTDISFETSEKTYTEKVKN
jgi:glutamyl-tRNA(Gln) amidotransferase subunit D